MPHRDGQYENSKYMSVDIFIRFVIKKRAVTASIIFRCEKSNMIIFELKIFLYGKIYIKLISPIYYL